MKSLWSETARVLSPYVPGERPRVADLRERAILVRHFDKPRTTDYLRITVGTEDDTQRLIAAAADILNSN